MNRTLVELATVVYINSLILEPCNSYYTPSVSKLAFLNPI